jgi:hypothetical protein
VGLAGHRHDVLSVVEQQAGAEADAVNGSAGSVAADLIAPSNDHGVRSNEYPRRSEVGSVRDDPLVLLLAGFVLTSVLGGALAYAFQRRAWRHQYRAQQADLVLAQALKTFEEVSVLLDQRLYRMRRVFWAARRLTRDPARTMQSTGLDTELADYRDVVRKWNDNLNRIPALVHTYFGEPMRERLQYELYDTYSAIGEELDEFVSEVSRRDGTPVRIRPIDWRLADLSHRVYLFNVELLRALRDGRLGAAAQESAEFAGASPRPSIRFGSKGRTVRDVQVALRREGSTSVAVDGHFGRATEKALIEFQRSHGLKADGVAGPQTLQSLGVAEEQAEHD